MTESPDIGDLSDYQSKDSQQALDAALAAVRSYCGWNIAPSATATLSVWSKDGCSVFLPTLALTAITSVTQDAVVIDPATYTFESYGLIRRTPGTYFSRLSRVTVVFTHGLATMPKDAADVVLALAQRSISDTRGMVPRVGAGQSVVVMENYGSQLSDADKAKLAPYAISAGFA
jgi:hypothetical protein